MKHAQDIMTSNPITIQSSDELTTCIKTFAEIGIHYAPVVTPIGEVLGLMSEFALVKASLRHYLDADKHEKVYATRDLLDSATLCFPTDSIEEVVKAMIKSPTHRVLVMDNQKKLVGIISPKDILQLLSGHTKKAHDLKKDLEVARSEAEKLNSQIASIQESLDRYQSLLDRAPQMIHGVDNKGKIVLANTKIHTNLGYDPGELIGKDLTILYPKSIHHEVIDGLKQLVEGKPQFSTYSTMLKKDGTRIRVDIASSSLLGKDGRFLHTITISREVDSEALLRALHGVMT